MATPTAGTVTVPASTAAVHCGRNAQVSSGPEFASVSLLSADQYVPDASQQSTVFDLHGSGGNMPAFGAKYQGIYPTAGVYPDKLDYTSLAPPNGDGLGTHDTYLQWAVQGYAGQGYSAVKPWDRQPEYPSTARRESFWMGWTDGASGAKTLWLYTEHRLDMLMRWVEQAYPQLSKTKRYCGGGSMGAWGTISWALRRPTKFAAIYPDRPRVKHSSTGAGYCAMPDWNTPQVTYPTNASPPVATEDGGGTSASHLDAIAYVSNSANAIPWIGWCVGRLDGFMPFQDHIDFVAALRATGRGFAFAWNNGTHSTGSIMAQIQSSYPYGMFEVGIGYPIYSNNSGDQDPAVDLVGGINLGFSHRNVTESAGAWSCQITNLLGARTVTVRPKSSIYTGPGTPQVVTIPSANTWVTVTF